MSGPGSGGSRRPTSQAYQLYLQGRHCYTRYTEESIRKGIEYFQQAIAADPEYALAHAGMALAYAELARGSGWRRDAARTRRITRPWRP